MRTLFADQPIPETLVAAWIKTEHQRYDIMIQSSCSGHLIRDVHIHTLVISMVACHFTPASLPAVNLWHGLEICSPALKVQRKICWILFLT